MWEYLSLYAERDDSQESFYVKHFPERGNRVSEQQFLNDMGNDGWELVAVTPAYGAAGAKINHQLYFKRPKRRWGEETSRLNMA